MQTLRILVAEDDKLSATLLKAMLEAEGHEVCAVATTGRATIEAANEHKPDAVLMDIYLADEMSGVDAARCVVYELEIPTIFITGASDPAIMDVVAESGALSFIKKPVSADELRANLRIILYHQTVTGNLRKSAKRYREILDGAPVGIFLCDSQGKLLECNATLAAMLGYGTASELMTTVPSIDVLFSGEERHELVAGMLAAGVCISGVDGILQHKDGSSVSVKEYGTKPAGGEGYQGMVQAVQVNEPQAEACPVSSRMLRCTIDAVPDLVVVMTKDRQILEANKAFYKVLGRDGFPFVDQVALCSGECPFTRFLGDEAEHAGWVRLVPEGPEYYNTVSPVVDDTGQVVAAVQVFRAMPKGGYA